ncbi:MAG: 3,4-dihydroxy-2-butanone-4-phosphate synthase [Candidatus Nezhaarchaeales archaeon]
MEGLEEAIRSFRSGKYVLIYDWSHRESEVDMVCYAGFIDHHKIYELRTEAGGLICFGTNEYVAKVLGLPLMVDLLSSYERLKLLSKKPSYGDVSPFTIWVNSVDVRTGISDVDRAKTISKLHQVISAIDEGRIDEGKRLFYEEFYAPGHVPILVAKDPRVRKGHTELSVLLAKLSGLKPSVVFAEMLSYGTSMSLAEAKKYAEKRGLVLVTGDEMLSAIEG